MSINNIENKNSVNTSRTTTDNFSKDKLKYAVKNHLAIGIAALIVVAAVFVFLVPIVFSAEKLTSELSVTFVLLWFCGFSMYMVLSDEGKTAGRRATIFINAVDNFEKTKTDLGKDMGRLSEFCSWWVLEDLKLSRTNILEREGIDYKEYESKYISKSKDEILKLDLPEGQKYAIIQANACKATELVPEQLKACGRKVGKKAKFNQSRKPLSVTPNKAFNIKVIMKIFTSIITSLLFAAMVFQDFEKIDFTIIPKILIKILFICLSGYSGYKMGYDNITEFTVNYINEQIDYLLQFNEYIQENPKRIENVQNIAEVEKTDKGEISVKTVLL